LDELRKHNQNLLNAGKLNPALAKEISVQNPANGDSLSDTFESIASNFSNHAAGKKLYIQHYNFYGRE